MSGSYIIWPPPAVGGAGGSGVTSIGSMDAQAASFNGAAISGTTLFMQSASSATSGAGAGLVNAVAQAFLGTKTFVSAPIVSSLAGVSPVFTDATGQLASGSVSLTTQVVGVLPLANTSIIPIQPGAQTSGSISLTQQVSGILPAANLPPLSGITGSVSLTTQVSGLLPLANMNLSVGGLDIAAANPNAATLGSNSLYLQSASASNPGIVSSFTQTFGGVKTFNAQILATGGIGLGTISSGTIAMLSVGADANTKYIVIGSMSGTGFYPRIGLQMNNPQASIHFGSLNGNTNTTSGVVGSFSVILGGLNATAAVGVGAFIAGGTGGLNTASGQDSCAIGYNDQASGIGAAAVGYANNASGNFSSSYGAAAHAAQDGSCTLGYTAQTTTSGGNQRAVAIGESATAQGNSAIAIGFHATANIASQVVLGSYNIIGTGSLSTAIGSTDEVLVVGIGTSTGNANGLSVTRDGGTRFYTSSGTSYVALYAGTTTSYAMKFPGTQASSTAQIMVNDGTGQLNFRTTGWQQIGSTQSANNSSTIDFVGLDSTFTRYMITMDQVSTAMGSVTMKMRIGLGALPTFVASSSAYVWSSIGTGSGGGSTGGNSTGDTAGAVGPVGVMSPVAGSLLSGDIYFSCYSSAISFPTFRFDSVANSGNIVWPATGATTYVNATTVFTGVRLLFSLGSISGGIFRLWGM